jgi:plastocyanin
VQPADSKGGQNYGWPIVEGAHCYLSVSDDCNNFGTAPVAEYNHTEGCSITGIGVYRGTVSTDLDGIYFASDYCSGKVWGLQQGDDQKWVFQELLDTDLLVTGSGEDESGELYLTACKCQYGRDYDPLANPTGTVWRIVASDQVPEGAETVGSTAQSGGNGGAEVGSSSTVTNSTNITSTEGLTNTGNVTGTEGATSTEGVTNTEGMTSTEGMTNTGGMTNTEGTTSTEAMTSTEGMTETGSVSNTEAVSGTETTGATTANNGEAREIDVIARSMEYEPGTDEPITIQQGETVRFVVTSPDIYHTFTVATDKSKQNVLFNLDVFPGKPVEQVWTFDQPGSYYLYCIPHEALGMVGSIEVK